jgi:hypothetical protein
MADEKPTHRVKTPVRHNGEDYAIGDKITLSKKHADAMGSDVVEPLRTKEEAGNGSGAQA